MNYRISPRTRKRMQERGVTEEEIDEVMQNLQQIADGEKCRKVYQSLIVKDGRMILL